MATRIAQLAALLASLSEDERKAISEALSEDASSRVGVACALARSGAFSKKDTEEGLAEVKARGERQIHLGMMIEEGLGDIMPSRAEIEQWLAEAQRSVSGAVEQHQYVLRRALLAEPS